MTYLVPELMANLEQSKRDGGIDIDKFLTGTRIDVQTQSTRYIIEILHPRGLVRVYGGKHFPMPTIARLIGSTWGESFIKLRWIGKNMCMEFVYDKQRILTDPVQSFEFLPSAE